VNKRITAPELKVPGTTEKNIIVDGTLRKT
jgi:hypothetical protein